jgi:hypothetical protein
VEERELVVLEETYQNKNRGGVGGGVHL